jgi:hypothetical protein
MGLMASARDPLSAVMQQSAQSPLYAEIVDYLSSINRMPPVVPALLPEGTRGRNIFDRISDRSGTVYIDPTQANPSTPVHELSHVADRAISDLHTSLIRKKYENTLTPLEQQFMQAYEKLVYGTIQDKQPLKRLEMVERLDPAWAEKNRSYRTTQDELAAFGVGSTASQDPSFNPPLHLDPTMATEFNILLDIAKRLQASRPQPTYTRTRE